MKKLFLVILFASAYFFANAQTEKAAGSLIQSKLYLAPGKTIRYDLYIRDTIVKFTGKNKKAIAVNGSIPAPTLVFTEGDTAEIYLHNMLHKETSLHWHGVILPNQADGVPFLTTKPVGPGETHLYKFKVVQNGTYWYHSHSALQEQSGMYGALIFKTREQAMQEMAVNDSATSIPRHRSLFDKDYTVVLSEWADENPMQIQRRLRTANDWFSIKKGSTQSYSQAIKEGYFKTKLTNEWKRMKAMDVSDVFYDKFLLNGQPVFNAPEFLAGDRIRLKVVNAGASSYFWLGYAGGKITVIGNDGNDVVPVSVDRLIIAPAETYDLVVTIPEDMSYEFRATSEDRTGYSSLWLGKGHRMAAPTLPRLKYFEGMKMMNDMMSTNGKMKDMGMQMSNQVMDMNAVMYPEFTRR
jgi:FtsP/CotA-like multicopper oxidase with cupredoxin domain